MTSASFGITDKNHPNYYDERIKKSIRISGAGEFVHLADWNIPAHGVRNTSHGCINVAPAYIFWFYEQFGAGDIVDVKNTPKRLDRDRRPRRLGDAVGGVEEGQRPRLTHRARPPPFMIPTIMNPGAAAIMNRSS